MQKPFKERKEALPTNRTINSGWETWLPNGTYLALSKGGRTCPLI